MGNYYMYFCFLFFSPKTLVQNKCAHDFITALTSRCSMAKIWRLLHDMYIEEGQYFFFFWLIGTLFEGRRKSIFVALVTG